MVMLTRRPMTWEKCLRKTRSWLRTVNPVRAAARRCEGEDYNGPMPAAPTDFRLYHGNDLEVLVKPVLKDWAKTEIKFDPNGNVVGWTTKETWEVEVQNTKEIDVQLDIRRNFAGDWSLVTTAKYEKLDANKVKFVLPLKSRAQQKFSYELTTKRGTNATR